GGGLPGPAARLGARGHLLRTPICSLHQHAALHRRGGQRRLRRARLRIHRRRPRRPADPPRPLALRNAPVRPVLTRAGPAARARPAGPSAALPSTPNVFHTRAARPPRGGRAAPPPPRTLPISSPASAAPFSPTASAAAQERPCPPLPTPRGPGGGGPPLRRAG